MGKIDIRESVEVQVEAERAREIIGPNFLSIDKWGRGISKTWENETATK